MGHSCSLATSHASVSLTTPTSSSLITLLLLSIVFFIISYIHHSFIHSITTDFDFAENKALILQSIMKSALIKPHFSISTPQLSSLLISKTTPNFIRVYKCKYNHVLNNQTTNVSCSSSSSSSSKVSPTHYAHSHSHSSSSSSSSSSLMVSGVGSTGFRDPYWDSPAMEATLEKVIYRCRFVAFLGVFGSLIGSILCFIKGSVIVASSFVEHFARSGKVIVLLVEAIDLYLLGTVMLVFGMGLYELFVSNLDIGKSRSNMKRQDRSNLFGLFAMMERPRWLEIKSVNELKTKVGHVIVLLLLIGFFDNCKKAAINTTTDLLCFAASVLFCSGCLYMLSKLNDSN